MKKTTELEKFEKYINNKIIKYKKHLNKQYKNDVSIKTLLMTAYIILIKLTIDDMFNNN